MPVSTPDPIVKEISFLSGKYLLIGNLHLPTAERAPIIIGSHGLFSNRNSPKQIELALRCNAVGMGFFRFDHRGCGQSQGSFQDVTSLDARCTDLLSAVKFIQARSDTGNRLGLFGSSMGGAVCISVASSFPINAVVTFAAPVHSSAITYPTEKKYDPGKSNFLPDEKHLGTDLSDKLSCLHHILVIHGDADDIVSPSSAHEIYSMSGNPKKLIIQKHGDHRMSNKAHQKDFVKESVNWFKTYLLNT